MTTRGGRWGRSGPGHTVVAAALTLAAIAVPCTYWYVAESHTVAREGAALAAAPRVAAEAAARRIAGRVAARLAALLEREDARPFFHYQNLYVDPRGAYSGPAVAPSPLADGPTDPLVAGNFQVNAEGQLTLPTVNPEIAELNAAGDQLPLRDRLARTVGPYVVGWLAASGATPIEAPPVAQPVPQQPAPQQQAALGNDGNRAVQQEDVGQQQVQAGTDVQMHNQGKLQEQRIASSAYLSNENANEIWREIQATKGKGKVLGQVAVEPSDALEPVQAVVVRPPAPVGEVVVRVGPLGWHALTPAQAADAPALVALRRVETPDGLRVQGFEVKLAALADLLSEGDPQGRLRPGVAVGEGVAPVLLSGAPWHVEVDFSAAEAAARGEAEALSRGFTWRFALGAALAILAGLAVVLMIAHAERLSRRRVQFAASAAHELRTPLAGVRMYGEMLAEGLGNPDRQRTYARRVAAEADRLGRVVSNVLDFTRLERGNLSVAPAAGDVGAAVTEIAARIGPTIAHHGATLEVEVAAGLPAARFDKDALAQILSNLVDNAEKYGRGSADRAIAVRAARVAEGIRVSVTDHGPGIAASLRRRLFRPFSRGAAVDQPAGLGLGLALTRALADAQGGRVDYRDAQGGGAEFGITLPLAEAAAG